MPDLKMIHGGVIDGVRYEPGDVAPYTGNETEYLVAIGLCELAPTKSAAKPAAKPATRTKAEIEADLAAARAAEAQLQADLSQAAQ